MNGISRMKTAIANVFLIGGAALWLLAGPTRAASDGDASKWYVETVDASGPGKFSSLRVDKDGNVHVAYSIEDGNRYPLKYAIRTVTNQRWFTMPVATGAAVCSLT